MALAILELLDIGKKYARFKIDTGTNGWYGLRIGRSFSRRAGIEWVDDVYYSTAPARNAKKANRFDSSTDISIPAGKFEKENAYVQLFSYKTPEGRSPAFSKIIRIHSRSAAGERLSETFSRGESMSVELEFRTPRRVPCRSRENSLSRAASIGDLLSEIIKVAEPIVLKLISDSRGAGPQKNPSGAAPSGQTQNQADAVARLIELVLGSIKGIQPPAASASQSFSSVKGASNRFVGGGEVHLARPFFWQAILQAAIGPLIQALPQLMNVVTAEKMHMKDANNKLITDILSDVNRRLILQQLQQAQGGTPSAGQPDISQLIRLLQQAPAVGTEQKPPAAASAASSMSLTSAAISSKPSSKAVLSFENAEPVLWNGMRKKVFANNRDIKLKARFNVSSPVPAKPLPKGILKVLLKDKRHESVLLEKIFRLKNIEPNSLIVMPLTQDEASRLPLNRPIGIFAELRWPVSGHSGELRALGSSEIVLVGRYFVKEQGGESSAEREPADMKRFRPFWNRIWESAPLDGAGGAEKKYLWEIDVNAKYTVLLSADHDSNGLMQTKLLQAKNDEESVALRTEGRMKAGIELSVSELGGLLGLWNEGATMDRDRLEAFKTETFAESNSGEFIRNFKMKGRAPVRGALWVAPIFRLFEFRLCSILKADDSGQVIETADEKVMFPLPVSARVIGLKSRQ